MNTYAPEVNTETHDFVAHISRISFDFSGYEWEEEFESEQEWIEYKAELNNKYSAFSVYFEEEDLPESDDEDETLEEFYESTHCTEEGPRAYPLPAGLTLTPSC